jgi:hypothetical protein
MCEGQSLRPGLLGSVEVAGAKVQLSDDGRPGGVTRWNSIGGHGRQTGQAGDRAVAIGLGHCAVEDVNRGGGNAFEGHVETDDLAPVGLGKRGGAAVLPGNGGLDMITRERLARGRADHPAHRLADQSPIPGGTVLLIQKNDGPGQ